MLIRIRYDEVLHSEKYIQKYTLTALYTSNFIPIETLIHTNASNNNNLATTTTTPKANCGERSERAKKQMRKRLATVTD